MRAAVLVKTVDIRDDLKEFISARVEEKKGVHNRIMEEINKGGKYVRMNRNTLNLLALEICRSPSDSTYLSNILVRAINLHEMTPEMKKKLFGAAISSRDIKKYRLFSSVYKGPVFPKGVDEKIIGALKLRGRVPRMLLLASKKLKAGLDGFVSAFKAWSTASTAVVAEEKKKKT